MLAAHEVTACGSEAVLTTCLLCDSPQKNQCKVQICTHALTRNIFTRMVVPVPLIAKSGYCIFCDELDLESHRCTDLKQDGNTHAHRINTTHGKVLTTRTRVNAETKQSNAPTLADICAKASLACFLYVLHRNVVKYM